MTDTQRISLHPQDDAETIRQGLKRVLAHPEFTDRARLRNMLQFLVIEELEGRGDRLKGYAIGTRVLGRDAGFDSAGDAIVRVEMNRLRSELDRFYVLVGPSEPMRITVPKGRYRPNFSTLATAPPTGAAAAGQPLEPDATNAERPPTGRPQSNRMLLAVAFLIVAGLGILAGISLSDRANQPAPILSKTPPPRAAPY